MKKKPVRVRIAPSPTGDPHVGLAYMTLFNYVFAKKQGGKLVLRIEDTDQSRTKASSEELIFESLKWLGLQWDEGPDIGGPKAPYRQSERRGIYRQYADELVSKGKAYHCFCSQQRIDELRDQQRSEGKNPKYDGLCKSLSQDEVEANKADGVSFVIRLATPEKGQLKFFDELRGDIEFDCDRIDDQVLLKSDGYPTYHLANIIDDHLMEITHVIRAEEWINSTPKHILLYEAFGWEKPKFIHMPLLRNSDRSKISKRKNPISLNYFRRKGIIPKALVNFLALMGWAYSSDEEIFSLDEMVEKFEIKDMHLGGPVFDMKKLNSINQSYLQKLNPTEFTDFVSCEILSKPYLEKIHPLMKERIKSFDQFIEKSSFFFSDPKIVLIEELCPANRSHVELIDLLEDLLLKLDDQYTWEMVHLEDLVNNHRKKLEWKAKEYFPVLRLIVTGRKDSPPLLKTMEVIGREIVRARIRDWINIHKAS